MTQPPPPPYPPRPGPPGPPYPARPQPPRKSNAGVWIILAIVGLLIALCGGCGAMLGNNDRAEDSATTTGATTYAAAPAPPTTARRATSTAPAFAPGQPRSPRCVTAPDQYVAAINGAFNNSAYVLGPAWAIQSGKYWWISANIMEGDRRVSSADVWVAEGPLVFALSGDARRNTMLVDGRDLLNLSAGDDDGLAVQACVSAR